MFEVAILLIIVGGLVCLAIVTSVILFVADFISFAFTGKHLLDNWI